MTPTDIVTATYREQVARLVQNNGEAADRREAVTLTAKVLAAKARAGEIAVDFNEYFANQVLKADEADGSKADVILAKATEHGALTLFDVDLDVIVTLGGGKRKPWNFVTRADLTEMNTMRFDNVRRAQQAYHKEWLPKYFAVSEVLIDFHTFGDAYRAGGFPPQTLLDEVA